MRELEGSVEFDHYSEDFASDPYPLLAELRATCPVAHSNAYGGFWVSTRYEDIEELMHRPDLFSARYSSIPNDIGLGDVQIPPLQIDPPEHTRYKKLLSGSFLPGRVKLFEPDVRTYVQRLLADLAERREFDAAEDFAMRVPTAVLCQLLGVPDDIDLLLGWVERLLAQAAIDPEDAQMAGMEVFTYVNDLVAKRKADPGEDAVSHILAAEVDGEKLRDDEVVLVAILLILAGIDTTAHSLGSTIHHLATTPGDQARLRAEPALLPSAIEEFLRAFAPVTVARQATCDMEWRGQQLQKGEMVLVSFPSANRDEKVFERADEIVLDREANRHFAFGSGNHRCLGIHFARMELRIALEELLRMVPPFALKPGSEVVWTRGQVRGPKHLPVVVEQ